MRTDLRGTRFGAVLFTLLVFAGAASGQRVFFGNLHSHTSYSDGLGTPAEAYHHARFVAGLDFLAITEHNHPLAAGSDGVAIANDHALYTGVNADGSAFDDGLVPTALAMTEDGVFVAIYGQEVSSISKGNHVNVFDVAAVVDTDDVANGAFDDLLNTWMPSNLDSTGTLAAVSLNHPKSVTTANQYGRDDYATTEEWITRLDAVAHTMAIINGPSHEDGGPHEPSADKESIYFDFLNLGFHIAPIVDQDNHFKNWGTSTDARAAIVAEDLTRASLLAALKARHAYATEDKNLAVIARINGHLCGDRAPAPAVGSALLIEVSIVDPDEPMADYEIEVLADVIGGSDDAAVLDVYAATGDAPPDDPWSIDEIVYEGGAQYFLLRITQFEEDGDGDRVWTAPVWFEPAGVDPLNGVLVGPEGADPALFVASKRSEVYHLSDACLDAQRIKASNRIEGGDASQGRRLHSGCPRLPAP